MAVNVDDHGAPPLPATRAARAPELGYARGSWCHPARCPHPPGMV